MKHPREQKTSLNDGSSIRGTETIRLYQFGEFISRLTGNQMSDPSPLTVMSIFLCCAVVKATTKNTCRSIHVHDIYFQTCEIQVYIYQTQRLTKLHARRIPPFRYSRVEGISYLSHPLIYYNSVKVFEIIHINGVTNEVFLTVPFSCDHKFYVQSKKTWHLWRWIFYQVKGDMLPGLVN